MPTTAKYAPRIACRDQAWNVKTAREELNARRALIAHARTVAKPVTLMFRLMAYLNSDA